MFQKDVYTRLIFRIIMSLHLFLGYPVYVMLIQYVHCIAVVYIAPAGCKQKNKAEMKHLQDNLTIFNSSLHNFVPSAGKGNNQNEPDPTEFRPL
jgi:hypothetical protein